jgi:hypothetical protein
VGCPADGCTPGTGGYPAYCRPIAKIIVCDNGPVYADSDYQKEPAITMVRSDCDTTLAGIWMDQGGEIHNHLAMSLSVDRGRTWFAPGEHTTECPDPFPDVRRFLNDCYFAGCWMVGGVPECDLLPNDCGYTIEPTEWGAADEGICAGGNGYIYVASNDQVGLLGDKWLLFTRSPDHGATFGPFPWPMGPDRRLKHICRAERYRPDRVAIAASPHAWSDDVHVFWNKPQVQILAMHSTDMGDTFSGDSEDPELPTVVHEVELPHQVHAPTGTVDDDDVLYLVWADIHDVLDGQTQILLRSRRVGEQGEIVWDPPLATPGSPSAPRVVAGPFVGWYHFGGAFAERSVPSIAVDRTIHVPTAQPGPYYGWVYVVYADHANPPSDPSRIKFVRSCDGGASWSTPCTISPDIGHPERVQFYPRVEVDGRGNIGVSWYDTRFDDGQGDKPKYDIFFAYSSDGGSHWYEKRLSGSGTEPPYFNPNLGPPPPPPLGPDDYSAMTSDPTPGTSAFYVMPMGIPAGGDNQDIFSYEVILRARGDYAGDFDVDQSDAVWNVCWGQLAGLPCDCETLDFDDDGDVDEEDFHTFYAFVTGPVCECHGPCQHDGGCGDGGESAGGGFGSDVVDQMPPGCEAVAWFVTHAPVEYVYGFEERLIEYLSQHGDEREAIGSWQILECLQSALP